MIFHSEGGDRGSRVFCRDQDEAAVQGDLHGRLVEEDVRPAGASHWGAARILPHRPHPPLSPLRLGIPEGQVHGRPGVLIQVSYQYWSLKLGILSLYMALEYNATDLRDP